MQIQSRFLSGLAFVMFMPPSFAHHGLHAHYDINRPVVIKGTVKKLDARNPHSHLYIDSVNDKGEPVVWKCEMSSYVLLKRQGVNKDMLQVGESITVEGSAARRDPTGCVFNVGHLANGETIALTFRSGNRKKNARNASKPVITPATSLAITGNWIRKSFRGEAADTSFKQMMTAQGKKAHDNYDHVVDDPALFCRAASPIRAWGAPGEPTEIRQEGQQIVIHHEFMDVIRNIHMNSKHPDKVSNSEMGHSIGWYEGKTLVIESVGFEKGVVSPHAAGSGMLHSENFKLVERLIINPDNGDLELSWTAEDPSYFNGQLSGKVNYIKTKLEIESYNCEIEPAA